MEEWRKIESGGHGVAGSHRARWVPVSTPDRDCRFEEENGKV